MVELIFVHVPKTGGTSVASAIGEHYGTGLVADYADRPSDPVSPMNLDPDGFLRRHHAGGFPELAGARAVAGHFWVRKYDPVPAQTRATLLREPIARALSHYCFWRVNVDPSHSLCTYVVDNDLSFPEFCRLPFIRWFYSRVFFRDVDMASFDFVGDYDNLADDWDAVMASLGLRAQSRRLNEAAGGDHRRLKDQTLNDPTLMGELRSLFADDLAFYERHVRQRVA